MSAELAECAAILIRSAPEPSALLAGGVAMTSLWMRLGLAIDGAERLRGWSRWLAGAAVWGLFAVVMAAAWLLPGLILARWLR